MALTATMHRLEVALSDVDRGVYEQLELRIAQHPSESMRHLVTRTLAYCLHYEEGIAFGKGVSQADEPAVWIHDLTGQITTWIELGTPSADRLHKASKSCPRVFIYTQHDPKMLQKEAASRAIHRLEEIQAFALDPPFLDALGATLGRAAKWDLTRNDGQLYLATGSETLSSALAPVSLVPATLATNASPVLTIRGAGMPARNFTGRSEDREDFLFGPNCAAPSVAPRPRGFTPRHGAPKKKIFRSSDLPVQPTKQRRGPARARYLGASWRIFHAA